MAEVTMTVRTSDKVAEALANYAGTKSAGAIRAVEGFVQLRKYINYELKGVFTREELISIVDAQNGLLLETALQANKGIFLAHCEDAERLESAFSRNGANWDDARVKIEGMSPAQVFFLQDAIALFWERQETGLEEFIAQFL